MIDYLNEMKQNLNKKTDSNSKSDTKIDQLQDSSSFIFKLFSDLEQIDLDRINKV